MSRSASDRNLLFGVLALQMDFIGRDALFVTRKHVVTRERLEPWFADVEELAPIEIRRDGKVIRHFRVFRGTNLRHATPAFSRLEDTQR